MDELLTEIDPAEIKLLVSQIDEILLGYKTSIGVGEAEKTSNLDGIVLPAAAADISNPVQEFQQGKSLEPDIPTSIEIEEIEEKTQKLRRKPSKKIEIIDLVSENESESEQTDQVSKGKSKRKNNSTGDKVKRKRQPRILKQCPICKEFFGQLGSHMVHHGERSFTCTVCPKAFFHKSDLKRHIRSHSDEKYYSCPKCPMKFNYLNSLNRHDIVHTGEKRFVCEICNLSYTLKYHLKIHLRTHSGEKPYQCDECKKKYHNPESFAMHKKMHKKMHKLDKNHVINTV